VRFGVYEFEPASGELRKHGVRVKLEGQPVAVLAILLERPGELIAREELEKRLWPADTFVDFEHSLNAAVRRLRVALNDSAGTPRYIETLARRGYRFIAPVSPASAADEVTAAGEPSARRRWRSIFAALTAVGLAAVLAAWGWREVGHGKTGAVASAAIHSIAVLPLENLTGDPSQEYFADGMTEALTTDLAQIGALRVISRTSVMHYKKTRLALPQIARELGVDGIVEGSVVRSGRRVRISSQLILASTDQHLWAHSYERDLSDIVGLQGEVAEAIAAQVQVAITQQQRSRFEAAQSVNPEAYDLYLQGLYHWNQYSPAGTVDAIAYFRQAVQKDPGLAVAFAALAVAYDWGTLTAGSAPKDAFPLAKAAALKALQLDPLLPDAHTALALEESDYELDRGAAEKEFLRAIELNPNSALARRCYASSYLKSMGRYQEALAEAKKAVELDPFSLPMNDFLALMYMFAGNNDHSVNQFRRVVQLDPNHGRTRLLFAGLLARLGRYPESIEEFQKGEILSGTPPDQAAEHAAALRKAARSGRASDYWRGYLSLGLESIGRPDHPWFGVTDIAEAYAQLGNKDKAFEWLEKAYQDREGIPLSALNCDPGFRNLHGDPRFSDLLRRLHLKE
jgi:TolB-like protein/DNA-binding winged helix-turn-helix (wHTH) protein